MNIKHEKLKISGLVVIAALLVLSSRGQRPHTINFVRPAATAVKASTQSAPQATGTITGSLTFPDKAGTTEASVCAVSDSDHIVYCAKNISKDFSLAVPEGSYTVYETLGANPYDISNYRAYYTEDSSHTPIKVSVTSGQTVASINPNDWANKGDENIIAQINEQQKTYQRYLAYQKSKQDAAAAQIAAATTTPTDQQPAPTINNTFLDVGGVPTSEQQSVDSTQTAQSH